MKSTLESTSFSESQTSEEEDVIEKAGWLYADLFLALSVIFLATISFIPQTSNSGLDAGLPAESIENRASFANSKNGLTFTIPRDDLDQVPTKLLDFAKLDSANEGLEVMFIQIIGGYDLSKEDASAGQLRALDFAVRLSQKYPDLLKNAQRYIDSSPTLATERIGLRITLGSPLTIEGSEKP